MNLAKALKVKNRLAQKISELEREVQASNSNRDDSLVRVDTSKSMEKYTKTVEELIKLKIAIFVASTPMRETILRLGELKSRIAFLRNIDTTEGYRNEYDGSKTLYVVTFDILSIKQMINNCEEEIDDMQEQLDVFNHSTEVEIDVTG